MYVQMTGTGIIGKCCTVYGIISIITLTENCYENINKNYITKLQIRFFQQFVFEATGEPAQVCGF